MLSTLLSVIFRALRLWLGGVLILYRVGNFRHAFRCRQFQSTKAWRVVPDRPVRRSRVKPAWVVKEVAALSGEGCRSIEKLFNRIHTVRDGMTVGKSFVNYTLRKHRYEVEALRRDIKRRPPRPVPVNHSTHSGAVALAARAACGCRDRRCRGWHELHLQDRLCQSCQCPWTLLGHLFIAIGRYGVPRLIRSDNASVFRSKMFRWGCRIAGVRQQFSLPGCPWMNGRIERVFGTLKQKLDLIEINTREALLHLLGDFTVWYNVVRPHQSLAGLTPDEAWHGNNPYINAPRSVHWFEAWDGLLKGYYLRC